MLSCIKRLFGSRGPNNQIGSRSSRGIFIKYEQDAQLPVEAQIPVQMPIVRRGAVRGDFYNDVHNRKYDEPDQQSHVEKGILNAHQKRKVKKDEEQIIKAQEEAKRKAAEERIEDEAWEKELKEREQRRQYRERKRKEAEEAEDKRRKEQQEEERDKGVSLFNGYAAPLDPPLYFPGTVFFMMAADNGTLQQKLAHEGRLRESRTHSATSHSEPASASEHSIQPIRIHASTNAK